MHESSSGEKPFYTLKTGTLYEYDTLEQGSKLTRQEFILKTLSKNIFQPFKTFWNVWENVWENILSK